MGIANSATSAVGDVAGTVVDNIGNAFSKDLPNVATSLTQSIGDISLSSVNWQSTITDVLNTIWNAIKSFFSSLNYKTVGYVFAILAATLLPLLGLLLVGCLLKRIRGERSNYFNSR